MLNEEYERHLNIMGDRNSYSKTDNDATFMKMKDDHMNNGQLKPGYNLQIGVSSELIVDFKIFSNPTDTNTLIPFLESLDDKGLISYIKPQNYEKSKSRAFKKDLSRKDGLVFEYIEDKKIKGIEYKIFKNSETGKLVKFNFKFREYSNNSKGNIETIFGKELRLNRSIQVEGAFAVIKEDMKVRKLI